MFFETFDDDALHGLIEAGVPDISFTGQLRSFSRSGSCHTTLSPFSGR